MEVLVKLMAQLSHKNMFNTVLSKFTVENELRNLVEIRNLVPNC